MAPTASTLRSSFHGSSGSSFRSSLRRGLRRAAGVAAVLAVLAPTTAIAGGAGGDERAAGPDVQRLLTAWKEATGGAAWDALAALRTTGELRAAGLTGTFEGLEDLRGGRYVSRYDLGVAKGVQGFDGEHPWELTPTGEVVTSTAAGEVEAARTESWFTARGHWFAERGAARIAYDRHAVEDGRGYHVLRVHPEGGREVELWLDADTALLARRVERGATRTTTTTYGDWRATPAGVRLPHHVFSTSGDAASETTVELATVEAVAAPEASAFAAPEVRPDDFTIASGATSVTVPFELLNNHIYAMARVNGGEPRRFLVDTGGVNLLTKAAAEQLGVTAEGAMSVGGVGDAREEAGFARLESFTLGDVTFRQPLFIVLPFAGLQEAEGVRFDGLVGYEVFQRFAVTIDYARGELTLTRPEAFRPPAGAVAVPFRFDERHPVVDGSIDGVAGAFTIDTGSRSSLDLMVPFVEAHGLAAKYPVKLETITGWGLGGPARSRVSGTGRLELGTVVADGVRVELSAQEKGAFTDRYVAGNVGTGVLKRFTVAFDYSRQQIWLAPNGAAADPFDRSGLWLNAGDGAFTVEAVVPGGPGEQAGVAVGDRVVAVDGTPAAELRLPDLRQRLRTAPPGTRVRLSLEGPQGSREVELTLRELV